MTFHAVLAVLVASGAAAPASQAAETPTEVGSSACAGCHADQAERFKRTVHGQRLPGVRKVPFERACETCHGPGSAHAAAAGDRSQPGFATIRKPDALPADEASAGCLSCHKSGKHVMLWGTSRHKEAGLSCVKCHSVHHGTEKALLAKDPVETCLACHKKQAAQIQLASHHPLLEGKLLCADCHNPHGGISGNLARESLEDTCFKCHPNKEGPFANEHPPVVEECSICHKPHGSPNEFLLKQNQPFLCLRCHKQPHTESTARAPAESVNKIEERSRCTDCHREIHGSDRNAAFKK